jgi:hypothetical protein
MRRMLFGGLVVFAGAALQPGTWPDLQADYSKDPRFHALHRFFKKTGCPAIRYATAFLQAADDYNLDWRLLPSLSFIESTGGKMARNNNLFGWNNGNARFDSPAAGIHTVGFRLATSNLYRDKKLDELLATYNSNEGYGHKVKSVMRRISPSE